MRLDLNLWLKVTLGSQLRILVVCRYLQLSPAISLVYAGIMRLISG
jgi:hypothetical protein